MKTLAIKFKYLGDVVVMTPSLRALKASDPQGELHVLVPEESAALLENLPYIDHLWRLPRRRGKINLGESLPLLKALRAERFDRSVDFVGNDRGAWWSLMIGARLRLGLDSGGGFIGRPLCFHQTSPTPPPELHEARRDFTILKPWAIEEPLSYDLETRSDPALAEFALQQMPDAAVICHLSTSQSKKEWKVSHWAELGRLAAAKNFPLIFSSGASEREQALLQELKALFPSARTLPVFPKLKQFIAVLGRARGFVSGDTGPLHFAAGLGLPTVSLFGPSIASQWAPEGEQHFCFTGGSCSCSVHAHVCTSAAPCLEAITVGQVWARIQENLI